MNAQPGTWTYEYELPLRVRVRVEGFDDYSGDRAEDRAALLVRTWLTSLPGSRFETAELSAHGDAEDLVLERDDFDYSPPPPSD